MSKLILFQGDSVTDSNRDRSDNQFVGSGAGYARMAEGALGYDYPGKYEFLNRAISGNRIVDVYARIKADIINLRPDYLSILIGINDVWHEIGGRNGVDTAKFKQIYRMMIEEIKTALPDIKIMLLEPFMLPGEATKNTEDQPDKWEFFLTDTAEKAKAVKEVAEEFSLTFVPLQDKFNEVAKTADPSYWLYDGVHPTAKGHEVIKREWLKAFERIAD